MTKLDKETQQLLLTALRDLIHAEEAKNQALGKLVKVVAKLVPKPEKYN